jgi:hypothetical protein
MKLIWRICFNFASKLLCITDFLGLMYLQIVIGMSYTFKYLVYTGNYAYHLT